MREIMNYIYVMGVKNIDELKKENFKIIPLKDDYGIIFDDNKAELFEKYICATLENYVNILYNKTV